LQQIRPEVKRIVELEKITTNANTNLYSYTGNLSELEKLRQLPNIANDLKLYNENEPKSRNATTGITGSALGGILIGLILHFAGATERKY
jgi:hypothetical protein